MAFRLFVAIELEKSIRGSLDRLSRSLQDNKLVDHSIRWVRSESMHLTLKFLGEVEDQLILELSNKLTGLAGQFDPFDIEVAGLGCFPATGAARVLWCGISQGLEDLQALAEAIDIGANELGFALEGKKFSAHLTLARIKNAQTGHEVREFLEKQNGEREASYSKIGCQSVTRIDLIHSDLTRSGPVYTPMHHATLG